jgi:Nucleotide-diphospho-sugar transferase
MQFFELFQDADIMWFRNPFPYFHPDADFQIACDHFTGYSSDLRNTANGGIGYVKIKQSNHRIIQILVHLSVELSWLP